ncbi:hypothetical protein Plhal703r1_c24g0103931 [Plasmopara halstedii]
MCKCSTVIVVWYHFTSCPTQHKYSRRKMRNPFHRREQRASTRYDCAEMKERRSSIFHRRRSEIALLTPRDTVVTRISETSKSLLENRRQRRRYFW